MKKKGENMEKEEFAKLYGENLPESVDIENIDLTWFNGLLFQLNEEGGENIYTGFQKEGKELEEVWYGIFDYVIKYGKLLDKLNQGKMSPEEMNITEMKVLRYNVEEMLMKVKHLGGTLDKELCKIEKALMSGREDIEWMISDDLLEWCELKREQLNDYLDGYVSMNNILGMLWAEWGEYFTICRQLEPCLAKLLELGQKFEYLIGLGIRIESGNESEDKEETLKDINKNISELICFFKNNPERLKSESNCEDINAQKKLEFVAKARQRWGEIYEELVNRGYIIAKEGDNGEEIWMNLLDKRNNEIGKIRWGTRWKLAYFIGRVLDKRRCALDSDVWRFVIQRFDLYKSNTSFEIRDLSTDWTKHGNKREDSTLLKIIEGSAKVAR